MTFLFFLSFYLLPIACCAHVCQKRHRSVAKGVVLGLLFGWVAALGLWLALKRRNLETMALY
jgi:hypothetical protein